MAQSSGQMAVRFPHGGDLELVPGRCQGKIEDLAFELRARELLERLPDLGGQPWYYTATCTAATSLAGQRPG